MKKRVLFSVLLFLLAVSFVSAGTPDYVGSWYIGKESLSEMIDYLVPIMLGGNGISDSEYDETSIRAAQIEYELAEEDIEDVFSLELKEDGTFISTSDGTSTEGIYFVSKDNVLTLKIDKVAVDYGTFDADFKKLNIDLLEEQLGFSVLLEKKDEYSKAFVYLWPEIEKGEDADIDIVKELIKKGADPNFGANYIGERLVSAAISNDCPEDVILYLTKHTEPKCINALDSYGETALLKALGRDEDASVSVVRALLDAGADVSLGESWGYNPLEYAIVYCSDDVALALIASSSKEQLNALNEDDRTCLGMELYKDEEASSSVVRALLDAGADISLGTLWGHNLLEYAVVYCNDDVALALIAEATVEQLTALNENDETCLSRALYNDKEASISVVRALLDAGADVTLGEACGYNPLEYAIAYCSDDVALALIDEATVEQLTVLNEDDETCLTIALSKDEEASFSVVKALIDAGADITIGEAWGYNPLEYAIAYCSDDVALALIDEATVEQLTVLNEDDETCLTIALSKDEEASFSVVKALIDAGADITIGEAWGYNPLEYAIAYCSDDIALALIAEASKDQLNTVNENNDRTCLGIELYKDEEASASVVKALIDAGADATIGKLWGRDLLSYAELYCTEEVVTLLSTALQ